MLVSGSPAGAMTSAEGLPPWMTQPLGTSATW